MQAQNYDLAIGTRLGNPLSISAKKFISEPGAIEGYLGFRSNPTYNWFSLSGAYQHHNPLEIQSIDGLQWYFGGGATLYFWDFKDIFLEDEYSGASLGIQAYLGLEYNFNDIPVNLTVDWIPTLFFNSYLSGFGAGYGSLGVRYILN